MFIKSVVYKNRAVGWGFDRIDFRAFTLLVGLSGAGKSRILSALEKIRDVKNGETGRMSGVSFEIEFSHNGKDFVWQVEFENPGKNGYSKGMELLSPKPPRILKEEVLLFGEAVFSRSDGKITYAGVSFSALSPYKSALEIFCESKDVKDAADAFDSLFTSDFFAEINTPTASSTADYFYNNRETLSVYEVARAKIPVVAKLAYLFICERDEFDRIKERFLEFFPYVEDVFFENEPAGRYFLLKIKEKHTGVIGQGNLSSGMFKTIVFLSQMAMLAPGCAILIDEIENSLGLNCIDILIEESGRSIEDFQFIVTSHHPYIINNTDLSSIKVVTRVGGDVTVKDASEMLGGESSHESFFRLINASAYSEGIR